MNKCHTPITWHNDTTPAINETNLNYEDGCIDTIDDRVVAMDTSKANQSDLLKAFKDVSLNTTTGVITFTLFDNTTKTIDTLLEKVAINFDYDDNPSSAHYQNLIIELEDGTVKYIDMSALITEYEFDTSDTIAFTVDQDGAVSADVRDGSITGAKLQPNYLADVTAQANAASGSATTATNKATLAQSYAVGGTGTRAGEDTDNAKYYKEQAAAIVNMSFSGLSDTDFNNLQDGQVAVYNSSSQMWENEDMSAGLLPHFVINTDTGATVTISKGGTSITPTETSTGVYEADVEEYGTWTISVTKGALSDTDTVIVDTVKVYSISVTLFSATITVNYPDNMRGETFTCVNGAVTLTQTAPSNANTLSFSATTAGTWTVTGAYSKSVIITTDGETQTITFYALKTFATATEQEIADMVSEADLGFIDLYDDCGWRIGQEHSVTLTAINSSGTYDGVSWSVGESQSAQAITFVLMHKGLYELVTPVLNKQGQTRNTCSFVVGMKDCLNTKGYMNSASTNSGSWNGCARRNWCNGGFREAIPNALRGAFKQFKTVTASEYNSSSNTTSQDYFTLPAVKEVFGDAGYGVATEAAVLTRFTWYETSANDIKNVSGVASFWWNRSPGSASNMTFTIGHSEGVSRANQASNENGISPFGCL